MTATPANIAETSDIEAAAADEPGRQRKRGAELEQAIRDACVGELARSGYGELTIESVASRAQTGKASIYRRWATKQELVMDSVTDLMASPLVTINEREFDDSVSTRDALLDLMVRFLKLLTGPEGDAVRSVISESLRDHEFAGMFQCEFFDPRKMILIRLLERGVERGEVRPDAVDDFVPDAIAGALIHRVLIRRRRPSRAEVAQILDGFIMPAISPH
jgi:AcrR family transcriptional regulator